MFSQVFAVIRAGKYSVINVMDLRKGPRFFPFHSDLTDKLVDTGSVFDDLII